MEECLICNKKIMTVLGLCSHFTRLHKITSNDYYDKFFEKNNFCVFCQKETKYKNLVKGYQKFCSIKCYGLSLKNRIFSEDHKRKLSKASKGKLKSKEHKTNTSKGLKKYYKTHINPFKDKHHSLLTKEKQRYKKLGVSLTQEHKNQYWYKYFKIYRKERTKCELQRPLFTKK